MTTFRRAARGVAAFAVATALGSGIVTAADPLGGTPWARSRLLGGGDRSWLLQSPRRKAKKRAAQRSGIQARSPAFHIERAKGFEAEQKYRSAVREYERALRLDATSEEAAHGLAALLIDQDFDVDRGLDLARRAAARQPKSAVLADVIGWGWYKKGKLERARASLDRAMALDPAYAQAPYHLGMVELRGRGLAKALRLFQRALQLDPDHARAYLSLGLCYRRLGENGRACRAFAEAYARVAAKNPVLAREIRKTVRTIDPNFVITRAGIGGGRTLHPGLRAAVKSPSSRVPVAEAPATLPRAAAATRPVRRDPPLPDEPAARPTLDFSTPPGDPRPVDRHRLAQSMLRRDLVRRHLRLGKLYREYRLYGEASREFHTVINMDPLSPEARSSKTMIEELSSFPELPLDERIEGMRTLAEFLFSNHDVQNARLQYEKILLLREDDAGARKSLAFLLVHEGRVEEAEVQLRKALSLRPGFPEALIILGYVRARQRRFREAAEAFARALEGTREGSRSHGYAQGMLKKMRRFTDLQ